MRRKIISMDNASKGNENIKILMDEKDSEIKVLLKSMLKMPQVT
jgi:hypothetical protein